MEITTPRGILTGDSIDDILARHGRECLRGADLHTVDLRGKDLSFTDLRGTDLCGPDFCVKLDNINLTGADMRDIDLSYANLRGADMHVAYLLNADLSFTDLRNVDLHGSNLSGASLRGADLRGADLRGTNLRDASMYHVKLAGANLTGANLTGSNGVSRPHATTETPTANSGVNETSKPGDMTPAELKTLRESMGLTIKWLAARWHTAEYSVKRWERNRRLPDKLAQDMQTLRREYRKAITEGIAANEPTIIVPRTDATTPDDKPAAWHRSVAQRIRETTDCKLVYSPDPTPLDKSKD